MRSSSTRSGVLAAAILSPSRPDVAVKTSKPACRKLYSSVRTRSVSSSTINSLGGVFDTVAELSVLRLGKVGVTTSRRFAFLERPHPASGVTFSPRSVHALASNGRHIARHEREQAGPPLPRLRRG